MEAIIIIICKTLTGAVIVLYFMAIPTAFRMAFFTKGVGLVGKLPWIGRFLLAWLLYPIYLLSTILK